MRNATLCGDGQLPAGSRGMTERKRMNQTGKVWRLPEESMLRGNKYRVYVI